MNDNSDFVERCQEEYRKNPRSRVFAPLADAYRKMGLLDDAYRVCKLGVQFNPDFAGGRVAYARVLLERSEPDLAVQQLEHAIRLANDNLHAHILLAESFLKLRRPKDALSAYKTVLFLNPENSEAKAAVQKWEFLTADEYDDEVFAIRPVFRSPADEEAPELRPIGSSESKSETTRSAHPLERALLRQVERAVSLADAFTVRNDLETAYQVISEARNKLGALPEIDKRFALLTKRLGLTSTKPEAVSEKIGSSAKRIRRRELLKELLQRIQLRKYAQG